MKQGKLNNTVASIFVGITLATMISGAGCTESVETNSIEGVTELNSDTTEFQNPLLNKGADPWVIQKDGMYYYTHTVGTRLDLRATDKMEDLYQAEQKTIWTPPKDKEYSKALWAPELHYLDGKWYMYFAASHGSGGKKTLMKTEECMLLKMLRLTR